MPQRLGWLADESDGVLPRPISINPPPCFLSAPTLARSKSASHQPMRSIEEKREEAEETGPSRKPGAARQPSQHVTPQPSYRPDPLSPPPTASLTLLAANHPTTGSAAQIRRCWGLLSRDRKIPERRSPPEATLKSFYFLLGKGKLAGNKREEEGCVNGMS